MFLGIDLGTQSVKALLYDADSRRVADVCSAPLELISRADGTREQLAQWWLTAVRQCLYGLDQTARDRVLAISVSGQQHGFVALDVQGRVLAPVKLWCDTATVAECEQITARFGGRQRCIDEVGNAILPGYTASKIRWLKNHRPGEYAALETILLPHDYLNFYLTGERAMECGDASGTGMLDIRRRSWHREMLLAIDEERDLGRALPPLLEADAAVGLLRSAVAGELGLPAGIPVASGGGDNMMAAIGTGNAGAERLTASLGTSGTLFTSSGTPVIDRLGNLAAFCSSSGGWLPLLCTMNCTVATQLSRQLFQLGIDEFEQRVAAAEPGAGGVVTIPFFNGERFPNLPSARAGVLGLDSANYTPQNLLRSAMESATFALRAGLDSFRDNGCAIETVRLTGGGSRSATWRQLVADVFDLPVEVQTVDEGAAMGAALQALWMYLRRQGEGQDLQALLDAHLATDTGRACTPRPAVVCDYAGHYREYLRHVAAISPLYAG